MAVGRREWRNNFWGRNSLPAKAAGARDAPCKRAYKQTFLSLRKKVVTDRSRHVSPEGRSSEEAGGEKAKGGNETLLKTKQQKKTSVKHKKLKENSKEDAAAWQPL